MPTTFYPTSTVSTATITTGGWTNAIKRVLSLTRGGGAVSEVDNTIASVVSGGGAAVWGSVANTAGSYQDGLVFITEPLDAVTISGDITFNIRALESSTMANYGVWGWVSRLTAAGVVTDFGDTLVHATELGTTESARSLTKSPTSTAIAAGDRLMLRMLWGGAGGTTASGFTATGFYNGPTGGASGDSFVTFTETIALQGGAAPSPLDDWGMSGFFGL